MSAEVRLVSQSMYPVYGPPPIVFSGLYLVGLEYLPEDFRRFFLTDSDTTPISWSTAAFVEVYNRYFADEDYYLTHSDLAGNSSLSHIHSARLRPLIQTIDIVGDDELELTWQDFVEFQSGFRPSMPGAEVLDFKMARAAWITDAGGIEQDAYYSHYGRNFNHSVRKNHVAGQGAVLLHVIGNWSNPLVDAEYATHATTLVRDTSKSADTLDINRLTNRDDWIIRPLDDATSEVGVLAANAASINLFEGGEIYVPDATAVDDAGVVRVTAGDVDVDTYGETITNDGIAEVVNQQGATGAEATYYRMWVESRLAMSYMTDINFF